MFSPIDAHIQPSAYERYTLNLLAFCSLIAVCAVALKHPAFLVMSGAVFLLWRFTFNRINRECTVRFVWDLNARTAKIRLQGQWFKCEQVSHLFVSVFLLSFVCKLDSGKRIRINVPVDSLDAETFRRLKVALTFSRQLCAISTHN